MKIYKLNLNKFVPFVMAVGTFVFYAWLFREIFLGLAGM